MDVNGVCKLLYISEASTAHFDGLDSTVDAFSRSIAYFQDDCIDDSPQMGFNGVRGYLDGGKSTSHGPGQPALPAP